MSYDSRVSREIDHYKDLTCVHDLPQIFHYWSHKYLLPKFQKLGFSSPDAFYVQILQVAARHPRATCNILSVGAGNCDT